MTIYRIKTHFANIADVAKNIDERFDLFPNPINNNLNKVEQSSENNDRYNTSLLF